MKLITLCASFDVGIRLYDQAVHALSECSAFVGGHSCGYDEVELELCRALLVSHQSCTLPSLIHFSERTYRNPPGHTDEVHGTPFDLLFICALGVMQCRSAWDLRLSLT